MSIHPIISQLLEEHWPNQMPLSVAALISEAQALEQENLHLKVEVRKLRRLLNAGWGARETPERTPGASPAGGVSGPGTSRAASPDGSG